MSRLRQRAVLLDLDGTLVARDAAFVSWLASLALEADVIERLVEIDRGGHGPRGPLFVALGALLGVTAVQARARMHRQLPSHVAPRPEVATWLDAFAGPKIVVTNGSSRLQRAKLEAAELTSHVDAVVSSQEHGAAKPGASIFLAALGLAGVRAEEAIMIGDHPRDDVFGAQRVGLVACLVRSRWFVPPRDVPVVGALCEVRL